MKFSHAIFYMILVLLITAVVIFGLIRFSHGHSFYSKQCCADRDCHPVACEQINAVPGGFEYRDARGSYFFTRDKMLPSQDENCHVCILYGEHAPTASPTCVYLPARM